jgi:hypothetical protein
MRYILLIVLLLLGCGSDESSYLYTDITPRGYKVSIPESVYQNGLYFSDTKLMDKEDIRQKLLDWVDYQVNRWFDRHSNMDTAFYIPMDYLVLVARKQVFEPVDHWGLPCSYCENNIAFGFHYNNHIKVAIYTMWVTNYAIDDLHNYPPHVLLTGTETAAWLNNEHWLSYSYVFGYNPSDTGCMLIPHELDHAIGINHHSSFTPHTK